MIFLPELLQIVFSFLNFESLKIVRSISRDWKTEADNFFWKKARLLVKGKNCREIIHSNKLNIVSAIDIGMSYYNEKDLIYLFDKIFSSLSLKEMRIYEKYFISKIPVKSFSKTITSLEKVTLFSVNLTPKQTIRMFNIITNDSHKLKLLELNDGVNVENISTRLLLRAFESLEYMKITFSCLNCDQKAEIQNIIDNSYNKRIYRLKRKLSVEENTIVTMFKHQKFWIVGGAPGWSRLNNETIMVNDLCWYQD